MAGTFSPARTHCHVTSIRHQPSMKYNARLEEAHLLCTASHQLPFAVRWWPSRAADMDCPFPAPSPPPRPPAPHQPAQRAAQRPRRPRATAPAAHPVRGGQRVPLISRLRSRERGSSSSGRWDGTRNARQGGLAGDRRLGRGGAGVSKLHGRWQGRHGATPAA